MNSPRSSQCSSQYSNSEPQSLREALARRGIVPTYWQPDLYIPGPFFDTSRRHVDAGAIPGIEVTYLDEPEA